MSRANLRRANGRKFLCRQCGRIVGEHGYSHTGLLSRHQCPHGGPCKFDINGTHYAKCAKCQQRIIYRDEVDRIKADLRILGKVISENLVEYLEKIVQPRT
jgi:DNA-directed RNA polymerase subunit RPC12/RpoP